MYIVPGNPDACTDNDGNRFYDISCLDYRVVDISDIYNYTGEVNSDGHALDFEGAQAYTSDHFSTETIETAFIAIAPDQKINYMTDVIALYFGGNGGISFHIISKSSPALSGGNMSTGFTRPWLLASHNGLMGFIATDRGNSWWDYEWNWVAFANYTTGAGIGSFYPLEESEGVSIEYGWTDGGSSGTLDQKEIRLYLGFSVAGAWRCAVNGVVSGAVTFEWFKDGKLISTQEKRTYSDCTPSADELGVFSYHCVVTHATGITWETDPLTATVEVYNGGGGSGGGGDSSGGDEGGDSGGGDDSGGDSGGDDPGGGGNEPTVSEAWTSSFLEGLALGLTGAPLPIGGREPVAYLYNRVRLPPLPEWDKEAYPYAFIFVDMYGWTTFKATNVRPYYNGNTMSVLRYDSLKNDIVNGGWRQAYTVMTGQNHTSHILPFWTNFDLLAEDGSVYMQGTAPIPVYE